MSGGGRLSTLRAALVIARRDFLAILISRSFLFFLIGPLFPIIVGGSAGAIGRSVQDSVSVNVIGMAMSEADSAQMIAARAALAERVPHLPELVRLENAAGRPPTELLGTGRSDLGAVLSGTPREPLLTGPRERIHAWRGPISLIAQHSLQTGTVAAPEVGLATVATSNADQRQGRLGTAQAGQFLLFLLTMLLAGMVMSNLVEEKSNKVIEVLAAAIPMDAVFLGKLFAMLAISMVGIATWATVGGGIALFRGNPLAGLTPPALGWPTFVALAIAYFAMAYLLIGSVFLTIGGMATTVRDVQTMSMPATMLQLVVFFTAAFAISKPGSTLELAAIVVPFSSPYAMTARAALDSALWPHLLALAWQGLCVAVLVRVGAKIFRLRVMKSGPAQGKRARVGLFGRKKAA